MTCSPPKKVQCCVCYRFCEKDLSCFILLCSRWLSERTMTGLPIPLPMCKCQMPPETNWNRSKMKVGEAQGTTAMDQSIMGIVTDLHHQSQAVLQVGMGWSLAGIQDTPPPQQYLHIPLYLQCRTRLTLWLPPSLSPPLPLAPLPSTAQNSPSPPPTPPSLNNLPKDFLRWRRSWTNR